MTYKLNIYIWQAPICNNITTKELEPQIFLETHPPNLNLSQNVQCSNKLQKKFNEL
jgi:hypothetical protein